MRRVPPTSRGAQPAQMAAILENMTEALVIASLDGRIVTMNPAALRLHGFDNVAEAREHLREYPRLFEVTDLAGILLPPEAWPIARAIQGEVFANHEIRVRRRDTGREFIGSYSGTPVRDPKGEMILAITTIRDITEQKRREQEKLLQVAALESAANAIVITDPAGIIQWVNPAFTRLTGYSSEEVLGPESTHSQIRPARRGLLQATLGDRAGGAGLARTSRQQAQGWQSLCRGDDHHTGQGCGRCGPGICGH